MLNLPKEPKLTIELVPSTCHFSNVRTTVTTKEWDKIRFISYAEANHVCEICGDIGSNQGYKHNLECHEIWEYDEVTHIQRLKGLISLCPICHQVKHIGRTIAIGKEFTAYAQLRSVNKWTVDELKSHITESFEIYKERSKHEWILDLSILNEEPYVLNIDIEEKRKFKKIKYKKKRRKKPNLNANVIKAKRKKGSNKRPPKT